MARRRGILGRLGARRRESSAAPNQEEADSGELDEIEDPATELYGERRSGSDSTEDWEAPFDVEEEEEDPTDTGDWSPRDDPDETDDDPEPIKPPEPRPGDTGERIRIAADDAAQAAELRALDEIKALEHDLEQARSTADVEVGELDSRLRDAEARAREAEARAARITRERDEIEAKTREAAAKWVRGRVSDINAEARERLRAEMERTRAETEASVRAEAEQRIRAQSEKFEEEAERQITEGSEAGPDAAGESDGIERALRERDAAARTLRETLARLEDAERRATAAQKAATAAERTARAEVQNLIETETEGLRRELCLLYTSPSPRDGLLSRMPSSA